MTPEHEPMMETAKAAMDVAALTTLLGWWADALPHVATGFTALWAIIRCWETPTVQGLWKRFRDR